MIPRIEILIATHNHAAFIGETLESILCQAEDLLVRVMDDGSTDATDKVVARFIRTGRVHYERLAASGGPSRPRNLALKTARAAYVTFFDSDDLMMPGHLSHHLSLLETHPDWAAVLCDYQNFDQAGVRGQSHFHSCPQLLRALDAHAVGFATPQTAAALTEREAKRIASVENFSSACGVIYRREVALRLKGFDECLPASEDFDIFWRLLGEGPVGISTFCGFKRRVHPGNMSHEHLKILTYKVRSRLNLLKTEQDPVVRDRLKTSLADFLDALAYNQIPADRAAGLASMREALRYGVPRGRLPLRALRALARSYLGARTH